MALLRRKLTLVVLSAVLVGGAGAMLAGLSAARPPAFSPVLAASGSTGGSTGTGTTGAAPTATPAGQRGGATPRPTRSPTPTPYVGQTLTVHGDVGSINIGASSFVLNVRGGSYICIVSSGTRWSNPAVPNFSALRAGMQADVGGVYQGGGRLTATDVDADNDT